MIVFYGLTKGIDNQNIYIITSSSLSFYSYGWGNSDTDPRRIPRSSRSCSSAVAVRKRQKTRQALAAVTACDPPMEGNDGCFPATGRDFGSIPQDRFVWYIFLLITYNYHIFPTEIEGIIQYPMHPNRECFSIHHLRSLGKPLR